MGDKSDERGLGEDVRTYARRTGSHGYLWSYRSRVRGREYEYLNSLGP